MLPDSTRLLVILILLSVCSAARCFPPDDAKTYVVIAAIADYKNMTPANGDLNLTVNDARRVYDFFKKRVPANQMRFLINQQATRAQILKQLDYLYSFARPQDRVIFYFSGHGAPGIFVPYDFDNSEATSLLHEDVKAAFKRCPARTKLCIADACHSGSITKARGLGNRSVLKGSKSGIMLLMSSRDNETSIELPELKQGLFSYYLIQGLDGKSDPNRDHIVDARELFNYLSKNVVAHARRKQHNQHPVAYGRFDNAMPIVNTR